MQTIEERLDQLEKRNRRLTAALAVLTVAICAVVTMAATGDKDGHFATVWADTVVARHIYVKNDAGKLIVTLGANDGGHGLVVTESAQGKDLVELGSTVNGIGTVTTYAPNGKELVTLGASDNGGLVYVWNKTGEGIAEMRADDYGNGYIGSWDRKGKGRTLQPGP